MHIYGSGEILGGVSELSAKKLINGESAFRPPLQHESFCVVK